MNNWTIIGRLGKDAEVKTFQDGGRVANLNIAIDMQFKKADGTYEKQTQWVAASLNKPSEKLIQYLTKGTMILAEGRPKARAYLANGEAMAVLEMVVKNLELLSSQKAEKSGNDFGDLPFDK